MRSLTTVMLVLVLVLVLACWCRWMVGFFYFFFG